MRRCGPHLEEPTTEPQSNIRIVTAPAEDIVQLVPTRATDSGWLVVDGTGSQQGQTGTRSEAVRLMSRLAMRARSTLPLTVVDWHGRPTGDRLA
jgi:hypothetical protein